MINKQRISKRGSLALTAWLFALLLCVQGMVTSDCYAQAQTVTGTVVSQSDGQPLPGVNVVVKGTTNGTITDFDGKYSLQAENGATIVYSFLGFENQEIVFAGAPINVTLAEETSDLDEVVVVGYGVQKKKLVTGATVQVAGEDIAKMNTSNALTAMQSVSPGVSITQSSAQPGKGFKVNIRGAGTIGESSPLLIIDGVQSGTANDGLNGINPSDIESIDVLKDAASAAIYGARAANGVILVTTKQGKEGKVTAQYDGYVGVSNPLKRPATLGAQDYMKIVNETVFNETGSIVDWGSMLPDDVLKRLDEGWEGTDWFEEFRNENAVQQSHSFSLNGGTDRSKFALALNYMEQEGIIGANNASDYRRYTGRINSDHVLYKSEVDGRNVVKIGENLSFWYHRSHDLPEGNGYWNIIHSAYSASPLTPAYREDGSLTSFEKDGAGFSSMIFNNPLQILYNGGLDAINRNRDFGVGATFFLEIEFIKNLKYRCQFNTGYSSYANKRAAMPYSASNTDAGGVYSCYQEVGASSSINVENTISYVLPEFGANHIDVLVGQSIEKSLWSADMTAKAQAGPDQVNSLVLNGFKYNLISNYDLDQVTGSTGKATEGQGNIASVFGRINYNYDEKYLATLIARGDASNNFSRGNRWGFFPSASVGWVVSNEAFMESAMNVLNFFKIRGSWGQNGNCNIDNYVYLSNIGFSPSDYADYGYKFSSDNSYTSLPGNYTTGAYARNQPNDDVTWEISEQINVGFDSRFLDSRLSLTFDWYKKTTKDWLVQAPTLDVYGYEEAAFINAGDVENKGIEVALSWNDSKGDFNYNVGVNLAYNKNEVTKLGTASGRIGDGRTSSLFQNSSYVSLVEKGHAIGYFSGMSYSGIWQNQQQIDEARANGKAMLDNAAPGDCIWDDWNGDGKIDLDNDRHEIGDPNPDVTIGLTLGLDWKGLDFSVSGSGAFGHQIMQCYRTSLLANPYTNYTTDVFERWHGEGTSNSKPRLGYSKENESWVSTVYMQDADYFKIQNITLGYDFTKNLWKNSPFGQLRVYVQAQNVACFTGYTGVDPEVGSSGGTDDWAKGVDLGLYPTSRTYIAGVNIKF
ncbi:MAG: TonB-dependent receptor [Bacteroidales bacterium]|nr:TonB-dependent receptor [Bacteroidales bacterium]